MEITRDLPWGKHLQLQLVKPQLQRSVLSCNTTSKALSIMIPTNCHKAMEYAVLCGTFTHNTCLIPWRRYSIWHATYCRTAVPQAVPLRLSQVEVRHTGNLADSPEATMMYRIMGVLNACT